MSSLREKFDIKSDKNDSLVYNYFLLVISVLISEIDEYALQKQLYFNGGYESIILL